MFLFLEDPPSSGTFDADNVGDQLGIKSLKKSLTDAVKDMLDPNRFTTFYEKLEDTATKTSRSISLGIAGYNTQLKQTMFDVYSSTIRFGGEIQDTTDYMSSLASTMGKLPSIQGDVVKNAVALSKLTGLSVKEIGQYAGEFANIGLGQVDAMNRLNKIYTTAKKYGVDAQKLTKTVTENLTKANTYGFKNGVAGLTKMAAEAQKLGLKMDNIFKIAEDALDPEKAIEMAAGMQMLGGNVGALADPFRLMYLAQNDIEGLKNEFVKAAESSAIFNEQTGEFQITGEQMRRLRAQADQLGVSYDEIAETAIRAKKEQMVMSKIPLVGGLTEDEKKVITGLAEINNGKVQIQIPGTDDMKDLSTMSTAELKNLSTKLEEMGQAEKDLEGKDLKDNAVKMASYAASQLTQLEKQNVTLNQIRDKLILNAGAGGGDALVSVTGDILKAALTKINEVVDGDFVNRITTATNKGYEAFKDEYINDDNGFKRDLLDIKSTIKDISEGNKAGSKKWELETGEMEQAGIKDAYFPAGDAPQILSEGTLYKSLTDKDEIMVGTDLKKGFETTRQQLIAFNEILKLSPQSTPMSKLGEKSNKLQEMSTTTNNNINVSGGANVSGSVEVKVNGSGINMDDPKLSSLITAKVSAMIEERLSKGWNQKQGNVVS
jgi:hypothetical protein